MLRLLCSSRVRAVVRSGASVLDLGRSNRVVTGRQFRALLLRDGGCTHPGCGSRDGLEAHHVRHWLHGGRTDMANLVLLCRSHHRRHHLGEFTIVALGRQCFRFVRADGRVLEDHVDASRLGRGDRPVEAAHADVDDAAATTRWNGERMDRAWAISVLAQRREFRHGQGVTSADGETAGGLPPAGRTVSG